MKMNYLLVIKQVLCCCSILFYSLCWNTHGAQQGPDENPSAPANATDVPDKGGRHRGIEKARRPLTNSPADGVHGASSQKAHLDWFLSLPPEERGRIRKEYEKMYGRIPARNFDELTEEEKKNLRERLHKFNQLSPEEKERRLRQYGIWKSATPEQKARLKEIKARYDSLSEEKKQELKKGFQEISKLPEDQRQQAIQKFLDEHQQRE